MTHISLLFALDLTIQFLVSFVFQLQSNIKNLKFKFK